MADRSASSAGRGVDLLSTLARLWALFGGAVLLAMAGLVVVSVILRALGGYGIGPGAVPGDFELVEIGCAVAVFAFLPWCQVERGHVTVDLLAERMGARAARALGLLGDALLALCACVVAWRLAVGFLEKLPYGGPGLRGALGVAPQPFFAETSYDLQIPVWIPYAFALTGALLFAAVCLRSVWLGLRGQGSAA